jgi:hypothetical protein
VRWQDYLTQFVGLPPELVAQIEQIFNGNPDPGTAAMIAIGVIRGSDWYKVRYKGIGEGIAKGIIRDESDYNAYVNQTQQSFRRKGRGKPTLRPTAATFSTTPGRSVKGSSVRSSSPPMGSSSPGTAQRLARRCCRRLSRRSVRPSACLKGSLPHRTCR